MYSSGWSSVWTARWLSSGSVGMPFGTAHDASTPSRSRRRSQCRRRAWCSWITKRLPSLFVRLARRLGRLLEVPLALVFVELAGHRRDLDDRALDAPGRAVRRAARAQPVSPCLVDVRTVPKSRRMPWFAGESLASLLPAAGHRLRAREAARRVPPAAARHAQRRLGGRVVPRLRRPHGVRRLPRRNRAARVAGARKRGRSSCAPRRSGRAATGGSSRTRCWCAAGPSCTSTRAAATKPHSLTPFAVVRDGDRIEYPPEQQVLDV